MATSRPNNDDAHTALTESYRPSHHESQPYSKSPNNSSSSERNPTRLSSFISKNTLKTILGILFFLLLISTVVYVLIPKPATLHITDMAWERSIDIEIYKTVRESDWSIPSGGRLAYSQREIRSYAQVLDHYETRYEQRSEQYISGYRTHTEYVDLGNGYFDTRTYQEPEYSTRYYTVQVQEPVYRSEPVYDTKYYYDIERWVYERTVRSSGDVNPYWPKENLKSNERSSTKHENYTVTGYNIKDKNQTTNSYSLSFEYWEKIKPGMTIEVMISLGRITTIKSIDKMDTP